MRSSSKIFALRLENIDATMEDFKKDIVKLNDIITTLAAQSQRVENLSQMQLGTGKRVDELERRFNRLVEGRRATSDGKL